MSVTSSYQSILDAVEFDGLTKQEQETFLLELNSVIYKGTVVRTLERMDEGTRRAWYELLRKNAPAEEQERFLTRKAPYAETALADTIETLAGDILAVTA